MDPRGSCPIDRLAAASRHTTNNPRRRMFFMVVLLKRLSQESSGSRWTIAQPFAALQIEDENGSFSRIERFWYNSLAGARAFYGNPANRGLSGGHGTPDRNPDGPEAARVARGP